MDCTASQLRRGNRRARINAGKRIDHFEVLGKRASTIIKKMEARASRDGLTLAEAAESGMYAVGKKLLQSLGLMRAA